MNEWAGIGNYVDLGERALDTRVARLGYAVDPLTTQFPMLSPYQFASNTPIQAIDLNGKQALVLTGSAGIFGLCIGGEGGAGIAFTPQGISFVYQGSLKVGLGMSFGAGGNATFFPTASSIEDLKDWGYGVQGNGGFLGNFSASIDYSSGNIGGTVGLGAGAGMHGAGYISNTSVIKNYSYKEIGKVLKKVEKNALSGMININDNEDAGLQVFNFYKSKSLEIIDLYINKAKREINESSADLKEANAFIKKYRSANLIQTFLWSSMYSIMIDQKMKATDRLRDGPKKVEELEKQKVKIGNLTYDE